MEKPSLNDQTPGTEAPPPSTDLPVARPGKLFFSSWFRKILILAIILVLLVWLAIALGRRGELGWGRTTPSPFLTPLPQNPAVPIKIVDGNVSRIKSSGEIEILVDKTDYQEQGVTAFRKVKISPDDKKICFLAETVTPVWLYYAQLDGEVRRVGLGKNCFWSPDSQKIAFNNHTTDVSPVNILLYDTVTHSQTNLTKNTAAAGYVRHYGEPQWSDDGQTIRASYSSMETIGGAAGESGEVLIALATGEVTSTPSQTTPEAQRVSSDQWYYVKLKLKASDNEPLVETHYPLREYLQEILELTEENIAQLEVVYDTREGNPSRNDISIYNFNYYVKNEQVDPTTVYTDDYTTVQVGTVDRRTVGYLADADYCEKDSDCTIRHNFCTYGSFNYYHPYQDLWGCPVVTDEEGNTFGAPDEERGCETVVKYQSSKCLDNTCTAQGRSVDCVTP